MTEQEWLVSDSPTAMINYVRGAAVGDQWLNLNPGATADVVRDVFGNPFRSIEFDPAWRTEDVQALVAGMLTPVDCDICDGQGEFREYYPELGGESLVEQCGKCNGTLGVYDFSAMPILADALEDAGCINEEILNHCRGMERCRECCGKGMYTRQLYYGYGGIKGIVPCDCKNGWRPMQGQHTPGCWVLRMLAKKCRCCHSGIAIIGDQYDRCKDCQDMVPTRRGGFRQLGTYDG